MNLPEFEVYELSNNEQFQIISLGYLDMTEYLNAHKMSYDPEVVSVAGEKLNEIKNTDKDPKKRKKADEWLRIIF